MDFAFLGVPAKGETGVTNIGAITHFVIAAEAAIQDGALPVSRMALSR